MGHLEQADGYMSDDSSFYGDDHQQEQLEQDAATFCKEDFDTLWDYHTRSINVAVLEPKNAPGLIQNGGSQSKPESAQLFNHYKGRSESAWQLDETVDNFLKRLPPVGHNNFFGPWIYIANPWEKEESYTGYEQFEYTEFLARGKEVLQAYDDKIRHLVEKNPDMKAGAVTRRLGPDRDQLKKDLFEVASKCKITSGKWMFFISEDEVPWIWRIIANAVAEGRLGTAAKVAPVGETRLICVYTKDFTNKTDVARVLHELAVMGLVNQPNRAIYYKPEAYTMLDITRDNKYGLRASLYSSNDFPLPKKMAQKRPLDSKSQAKLDDWTL